MRRAHGIVPTTGEEWNLVQGALATIEGIANDIVQIETKPVKPAGSSAAARHD
jgi:hypothetical protein